MQTIVENNRKKEGFRIFLANVLLFFILSFLGWCLEKLTFIFVYGHNEDRGFLRLPFCTIYGGTLLFIRATLGVPLQKERAYPWNMLSLIGYAVGAALVATAAELFTGLFFERVFGTQLWTYCRMPHALGKYICLPMSVAWGGLITISMAAIWAPSERALCKLPRSFLLVSDLILAAALLADFCLLAAAAV